MADAELQVDNVSMRYGNGTVAIRDLSLTVQCGLTGLLGPNGAGKSTFMRILATIQLPTAGAVRWAGSDATKAPLTLRRAIGYLPQHFGAPASFTGEQVVRGIGESRGLQGTNLARQVDAALTVVNLRDVARKRVRTYSGGMLRRLGIAQAIVNNPRVLIVDEPTAGLDPDERVRFRDLLVDLARERIVILSTHIVSDIELAAEHVVVMDHGEMVLDASVSQFVAVARGHVWSLTVTPSGYQNMKNSSTLRIAAATRNADSMGLRLVVFTGEPPAGAQPLEPSFEDAYLYLMGQKREL
jgi:ABC-type multidrug transport system ATPase subunit